MLVLNTVQYWTKIEFIDSTFNELDIWIESLLIKLATGF